MIESEIMIVGSTVVLKNHMKSEQELTVKCDIVRDYLPSN
jgi:hypothetical protein